MINTLKKTVAILLLAVSVFTTSCKDDEIPTYSKEDSKDNLDASLVATVNKLEGISNIESIEMMESMDALNIESPAFDILIKPATEVAGTSLDSLASAIEEGLVNITMSDLIDWGTFTYNFESSEFDFKSGTVGTMVIKLPSSNGATSNDIEVAAKVEFKDGLDFDINGIPLYEVEAYDENGDFIEYEEVEVDIIIKEMFTSLSFEIKKENTSMIAYNMSMGLDSDNMPNKMSTSLTIEGYKVATSFDATDRSKGFSNASSFSKDGDEIIGFEVKISGDLSDEQIEDVLAEMDNEELSKEFIATLDYNIVAEMRFERFEIKGLANGKKIYDASEIKYNKTNQVEVQEFSDALNDAMTLSLVYDDGGKVGTAESYVVESIFSDENSMSEEYEILFRFKFEDGTYMSPEDENMDSELQDIFADFITAIEDLANKFEEL